MLLAAHVSPVNRVHFSFSVCGAHWPEMVLQFYDLMQASIDLLFGSDQLSERDLRQSILHYLMQPDDYRPDTTIARVNTNIQHARVRLAEVVHGIFVKNTNHLVQTNF